MRSVGPIDPNSTVGFAVNRSETLHDAHRLIGRRWPILAQETNLDRLDREDPAVPASTRINTAGSKIAVGPLRRCITS